MSRYRRGWFGPAYVNDSVEIRCAECQEPFYVSAEQPETGVDKAEPETRCLDCRDTDEDEKELDFDHQDNS